jgi:hypothetical protein
MDEESSPEPSHAPKRPSMTQDLARRSGGFASCHNQRYSVPSISAKLFYLAYQLQVPGRDKMDPLSIKTGPGHLFWKVTIPQSPSYRRDRQPPGLKALHAANGCASANALAGNGGGRPGGPAIPTADPPLTGWAASYGPVLHMCAARPTA